MKRYVLDTCALIALLNEENGASKVASLYESAVSGEAKLIMNIINLTELYYGYYREDGATFAEQQLEAICQSAIEINEIIDIKLLRIAGRLKATYRISLADSFAVAQAILSGAVLVSSDHHELDVVDIAGEVEFLWFR